VSFRFQTVRFIEITSCWQTATRLTN